MVDVILWGLMIFKVVFVLAYVALGLTHSHELKKEINYQGSTMQLLSVIQNDAISILGSKSVDFTTSYSFDKYIKIKRYSRITFMFISISMAFSISTIRLG
ncbi:hypothetical protein [Algicola sagamiensis]|uniref:hypothetical protein n=1 Tax=Algicola sagamiensis TaxID=163869 RepID=UPI0012FBCDF5|nr:hypothetical protein [Algicola sagamiensis]